jgi:actin-related protein 6
MVWLVVDQGGGSVKVGPVGSARPLLVPCCVAQPRRSAATLLVGRQVEPELSGQALGPGAWAPGELVVRRAMERGYPTDFEVLLEVWSRALRDLVGGSGGVTGVVVSVPPHTPRELLQQLDAMIRGQLKVERVIRAQPAALAAAAAREAGLAGPFCLVVDCGYSFSHVTPVSDGRPLEGALRRLDVGGKMLTNLLKELISYGQVNVMDDTYVVDLLKRELCFVSQDPAADFELLSALRRAPSLPAGLRMPPAQRLEVHARFFRKYVLPDFVSVHRGFLLDPATTQEDELARYARHTVELSVERFLVPEALFDPSVIGMPQAGLPELITQVLARCPPELRDLLRANVLVVGGTSLFPGFCQRLQRELGPAFTVRHSKDPITAAWEGGRSALNDVKADTKAAKLEVRAAAAAAATTTAAAPPPAKDLKRKR